MTPSMATRIQCSRSQRLASPRETSASVAHFAMRLLIGTSVVTVSSTAATLKR